MYLHFMDKVAWVSWGKNKVMHPNIFAPQQRSYGIVALEYQKIIKLKLWVFEYFVNKNLSFYVFIIQHNKVYKHPKGSLFCWTLQHSYIKCLPASFKSHIVVTTFIYLKLNVTHKMKYIYICLQARILRYNRH